MFCFDFYARRPDFLEAKTGVVDRKEGKVMKTTIVETNQ